MTKEEMTLELDEVVGRGNEKLLAHCERTNEDLGMYIISINHEGEKVSLSSGGKSFYEGPFRNLGDMKDAKRAMWSKVDSIQDAPIAGKSEKSVRAKAMKVERIDRFPIHTFEDFKREMDHLMESSNRKNVAGTLTWACDNAGIYVRAGVTPVTAHPRCGDISVVFSAVKSEVWGFVDEARSAVSRRESHRKEAESLAAESAKLQASVDALRNAGLSTDVLGIPNEAASAAIVGAAKKAVKAANRGLLLFFEDAVEQIGRERARMTVHGFVGGFVIKAGDEPVMVTRFPRVVNANTLEKTVAFVTNGVRGIGESHRRHLADLQSKLERERGLKELAEKFSAQEAELSAFAAAAH